MFRTATPFVAALVAALVLGGSAAGLGSDPEASVPSIETTLPTNDVGPFTAADVPVPQGWNEWGYRADDDVHNQCGDLKLVFLNPDLQENEDNVIEASGTFFIQFQAVGEKAEEITRFSFSFGKGHEAMEDETLNCNLMPVPSQVGGGVTGAYLLFYRSDFSADDGFFVPIETKNVPDGDYAAAVHAYTGNDITGYTEVARAWALATVDNCVGESLPNSCPNDTQDQLLSKDKIKPWPMILPGDGEQTNNIGGLTVEFAEEVNTETIKVSVNGEEVPAEDWTPPERDTDLVPLNDEDDCPATVRSVCERKVYGSGFNWPGTVQVGDILRVEAEDMSGNLVTKQIHYGFTSGGASSAEGALLEFTARGPDAITVNAGKTATFELKMKNVGTAEAHVNLLLDYNESKEVKARWTNVVDDHHAGGDAPNGETHIMIEPGSTSEMDVVVETTEGTPKGVIPIKAILEYPSAGETKTSEYELFLTVDSVITEEQFEEEFQNRTKNQTVEETEDSPGPSVFVVVGVIGLLAVVASRRRL